MHAQEHDRNEVLLVLTNLPDHDSATRLAQALLEQHAAACVNILAPCTSLYRWEGKLESANEVPMLIKTARSAYPLLEKLLLSLHPYELPEIIAVSVESGLPAYLQWVLQGTAPINVAIKE